MRTLNYVVAFVLVLFVAFGSVACEFDDDNGGGGSTPTAPTTTTPTTPTTTTPTTPVTTDPDPAHAPSGDGGYRFKGNVPRNSNMDDMAVYGRGSVGTTNNVVVCVWDTHDEDGDQINMRVAGYTLTQSGSEAIELFHEKTCWEFTMTTGYYYPISILALNEGWGGAPVNSGAVSADVNNGSSSDTTAWAVPLRTNAEASLVIWVP